MLFSEVKVSKNPKRSRLTHPQKIHDRFIFPLAGMTYSETSVSDGFSHSEEGVIVVKKIPYPRTGHPLLVVKRKNPFQALCQEGVYDS